MQFQILEIVLYPRTKVVPPRRVILKPGSVNVISGASKTGKSAMIPIIDYCLGSDRCAIPVETIRDACGWFGLLLETKEGQKFLARREPGGQKSTNEMFLLEGDHIDIPEQITDKNITSESVKLRFDELCGLSRLDFDPEGKAASGFKGRPSFRDLMAFTFQPQNIVANPDVLFFKADTYEHREKLKTIFPYVLKAVTAEVLAALHELDTVNRELMRKQREYDNLRQNSERWNAELRSWAVRARELGLFGATIPDNATREDLLAILQTVANRREPPVVETTGIEEAIGELVSLQREEAEVDAQLRTFRRRLAEMSKLKDNAVHLKDALSVQRDRLGVAKWLGSMVEEGTCPVCSSTLTEHSDQLDQLLASLSSVEGNIRQIESAPASFDRELLRVKEEVELCAEKLKGIALRKAEVERRSSTAREAGFRASEASRFLGRIDRALEMNAAAGTDGVLAAEIEELERRQRDLSKLVSKPAIESRRRRALDRLAGFASRLLPGLDAERPDDPIELSITDLTIKVKGLDREDYLWEIGSGANWLAYHIAMSLGLQQLFLADPPSPVPGFLVYDQPSQVYFPRRLAGVRSEDDADMDLKDEDVEAVKKVFSTLASVVNSSKGALQVLVLDHAPPNVWDGVDNVHLVEEWREGRKLVPVEWLD